MTERATRAGQRGVTLLELTVAMGIFAIVGAVLFGTFSRTATSRDLVERRGGLRAEEAWRRDACGAETRRRVWREDAGLREKRRR